MNAKDVLRLKGSDVLIIEPHRSVLKAIQILVESDRGALLVVDGRDRIQGILTERDILQACAKHLGRLRTFTVSDLMTTDVIIGLVDDSVESLMALMIKRRIRHLPILFGKKLAGILSLRDLVAAQAQLDQAEIRHLKQYISAQYPN